MKWATRAGIHIDRASSAWLIRRFIDPDAIFEFVTDLDDERFDAPEAPGLDTALRGLSMVCDDPQILDISGPVFDGLYEFYKRELLVGREPS